MIQKKTVIQLIDDWIERLGDGYADDVVETVLLIVKRKVEGLAEENGWIPFKERETDTDEKEAYGCDMMLDCKLPDDGEEIIVTYASGGVGTDVFARDGYECYLENSEIVTQAIAWMPLPEPYKPPAPTKPNWKESMLKHFTKVE